MPPKLPSCSDFNSELFSFLASSPTPFHATQMLAEMLRVEGGFSELKEADPWSLKPGGRHFVVRNQSSIVAFQVPEGDVTHTGFRLIGSHTDSPCLRLKPQPEIEACGVLQVGVEVYGGVLLSTWFDRDLSLAGRVSYLDAKGKLRNALLDFKRAVAILPNLAIHLNREVNESRSINKQLELPPLIASLAALGENRNFRQVLKDELERQNLDVDKVFDYELSFYDAQGPALVGLEQDFIAGARLDNLLSCFIGAKALLASLPGKNAAVLVCNDHEEVGSASTAGAQGTFLKSVLERICRGAEEFRRSIDRSVLVSTDNAHAIHPNYPEKHDAKHAPRINQGPALKINTNQRYATTSETAALFAHLCEATGVPMQRFVARTDMACGSTIGPITASILGVRTLDVGVPTFAMHSIRETAGAKDSYWLYQVLSRFYAEESVLA